MTVEELKKKLRDSLGDAEERGISIPRMWFGDDLFSADLKELGLKVVHTANTPFSWIKHEKGEIKLLEIEQFCHAHDAVCIAVKSEDDALEVVTAYQFFGDEDGLIAREIDPMHLPTGEKSTEINMHGPALFDMHKSVLPTEKPEDLMKAFSHVMSQLDEIAGD